MTQPLEIQLLVDHPDDSLPKSYIPFSSDTDPSFEGRAISTGNDEPLEEGHGIILLRAVTGLALRCLEDDFIRRIEPDALRVTALCSSHLDGSLSVDASVHYLAHQLQSDLVILDADELAHGGAAYGLKFCNALWKLYQQHYDIRDEAEARSSMERALKVARADLSERLDELQALRRQLSDLMETLTEEEQVPSCDPAEGLTSGDSQRLRELREDVADAEIKVSSARSEADRYAKTLDELKTNHAERSATRHRDYVSAVNHLRALLTQGALPSQARRRILYLRNWAAMSHVFSPLVSAVRQAVSDSGLPVLVVAGVWRVRRLPQSNDDGHQKLDERHRVKHNDYLEAFRSIGTLRSYVTSKFSATWRRPDRTTRRFTSLTDAFAAAIMHRYYLWGLERGSSTEKLAVDQEIKLTISSAVYTAIHASCITPSSVSQCSVRQLLTCNFMGLRYTLHGQGREWRPERGSALDEWEAIFHAPAPGVSKQSTPTWAWRLVQVVLSCSSMTALASNLLPWLPQRLRVETFEVAHALDCFSAIGAELDSSVDHARLPSEDGEMAEQSKIAKSIKRTGRLDEYEHRLLNTIVDPDTISTTYSDVCVQPNIIELLRSVVSMPLLYPEAYRTGVLGKEAMTGVLLYGPPGTGKTMLCRALAKESGALMLQIQASNIRSKWYSEDEQLISAAFKLARRLGRCVIFLDEVDALFGSRDKSHVIHRATLTEFLQEMDGFRTGAANRAHNVIVVCATNRPQDLDTAVLRRLPCRVLIDLPGASDRERIIRHYLTGEECDASVDLSALAGRTLSYSGSDLKNLVCSAALAAFKDTVPNLWASEKTEQPLKPRVISSRHFEQALREMGAAASSNMRGVDEIRKWGRH